MSGIDNVARAGFAFSKPGIGFSSFGIGDRQHQQDWIHMKARNFLLLCGPVPRPPTCSRHITPVTGCVLVE
jgi:hypothetical protein